MKKLFGGFSKGQSMVEMVVAIGMVALVLVAIVSGISLSVRNSRFSKNKALATRYAQEAVESFRSYRDEVGWDPFLDEVLSGGESSTYCLPTIPGSIVDIAGSLGMCSGEKIVNTAGDTEFVREVVVTDNTGMVEIEAEISWTEGSKTHNSTLISRFNEWTL